MASAETGYINRTFSMTLKKLYLDSNTADVFFVFDGEAVPAHKNLLASGSNVFRVMFYGSLKENERVVITDSPISPFKEFLQFFYVSRVKLTTENIYHVMDLSEKYDVATGHSMCVKFLEETLAVDNVSVAYYLANLYGLEDLRQLCVEFITLNIDRIFQTSAFLEFDQSYLSHILAFNTLACQEIVVFHACMAWVKYAVNNDVITKEDVQSTLGDLFYEIRFTSMTIEEFVSLTTVYGHLFSNEEYRDIVQGIASSKYQPNYFKNTPRQLQWDSGRVIECNRSIDWNDQPYDRFTSTTTFMTNTLLLLGELVVCPINSFRDGGRNLTICEIANDGTSNPLSSTKTSLRYSIHYRTMTLTKPVMIKPGVEYQISFDSDRLKSEGFKLQSHVQIDSNIHIYFSNTVGPILKLRFNRVS